MERSTNSRCLMRLTTGRRREGLCLGYFPIKARSLEHKKAVEAEVIAFNATIMFFACWRSRLIYGHDLAQLYPAYISHPRFLTSLSPCNRLAHPHLYMAASNISNSTHATAFCYHKRGQNLSPCNCAPQPEVGDGSGRVITINYDRPCRQRASCVTCRNNWKLWSRAEKEDYLLEHEGTDKGIMHKGPADLQWMEAPYDPPEHLQTQPFPEAQVPTTKRTAPGAHSRPTALVGCKDI